MTSTAKIGDLAFRLLLTTLSNVWVCLAIPFAFIAMFWACSTIDQPAPDTGQVTIDQPATRRPLTATVR